MTTSKCQLFIILLLFGLCCSIGCEKEAVPEIDYLILLPPLTIKKQGCFSPTGMTLIAGHLTDDGLFEEITYYKHHIEWFKNGELIDVTSDRLSCTGSGDYKVIVDYRELNITQEAECRLVIECVR